MPTLTTTAAAAKTGRRPRGIDLVDDHGNRLALPFAPPGGTVGGLAPEWTQVPRSGGRPALLIRGAPLLRTYPLEVRLVDTRNPIDSPKVDRWIAGLEVFAAAGRRVAVARMGRLLGGAAAWRITALDVEVLRRAPGTGAPVDAIATLELTRASDAIAHVGTTTGGARTRSAPTSSGPDYVTAARPGRTVTAAPGDTAYGIAYKTLGDGELGTALLDANGIRDARRLTPGTVLAIPAELAELAP